MLSESLLILVVIAGLFAWTGIVAFGLQARRGIRRDVPLPKSASWNTVNVVVFHPECLTSSAQVHRRRAGWFMVAFAFLILVSLVISLGIG